MKWGNFPWAPYSFVGPQLSTTAASPTRTAGFLGFGRIAQATLSRLIPFGITHCIFTSNPNSQLNPDFENSVKEKYGLKSVKRVELDQLARESDLLFVLAPGGEATKHIINEPFLRQMKKTSVLINPSRGTLVNSDDLAKALKEGWIWGAGLDVLEGEPHISIDHPLVKESRSFLKLLQRRFINCNIFVLDASSSHISEARPLKRVSEWRHLQLEMSWQVS